MSERREKGGWKIGAGVVLILLAAVGAYVGGYLASGTRQNYLFDKDHDGTSGRIVYLRVYDAQWKARVFWPASEVESLITGDEVYTIPGQIGYRGQ